MQEHEEMGCIPLSPTEPQPNLELDDTSPYRTPMKQKFAGPSEEVAIFGCDSPLTQHMPLTPGTDLLRIIAF